MCLLGMPIQLYMVQTKTEPHCFLNRDYTCLLRGICMIMIVVSHTANEFTELLIQYHLNSIWICGKFATGIFFFLSGYGLTLSIKRNKVDSVYIFRHIRNLIYPYFIFWLFYFLTGLCVGRFSSGNIPYIDFLFLKMPNADTWFFRTIFGVYIVYFAMARFIKPFADICIAVIIILYVFVLAYLGVSSWWWNTILCFPVGILYANYSHILAKSASIKSLLFIICLFIISYKYVPFYYVKEICPAVICCLFFAYLSLRVSIPLKKSTVPISIVAFIGQNSLYMYFMETIPIDYMNSKEAGFIVFVFGSIIATIVLTYLGKRVETYLL